MASNNVIRTFFKPQIELEELSEYDTTHGSASTGPYSEPSEMREGEDIGKMTPLVKANGVYFQPDEILSFELDTTGFLPTMTVRVQPTTTEITSLNAPVDGDIVQVFIASKSEVIKPVRVDFLITEVSSSASTNKELNNAPMTISGKMNIPHLYDDVCESHFGTSFEVLQEIAEDLKLGFASNVDDTDDEMTWVCSYTTREQFVKDIVDASWSSQNEFYTAYIDVYYNLNLVEVNAQLAESKPYSAEDGDFFTHTLADGPEESKNIVSKQLSNHSQVQGSMFGIKSYKPMNKASDLSRKYGYAYKLKFFDYSSMKPYEFTIEPMANEGAANSMMLMKGKPHDDSYKDQVKTNFIGIQYSDNVHDMYYYAKAHNMMNLVEIDKMNILVTLTMHNLNFIRYDFVPVMIFTGGSNQGDAQAAMKYEDTSELAEDGEIREPIVDKHYSGTYVLRGYKLRYNKQLMKMEEDMVLSKREWAKQYI